MKQVLAKLTYCLLLVCLVLACADKPATYKEGESLRIGWRSYRVDQSYWTNIPDKTPKAAFLAVQVFVRNDDNKPHPIPDMFLVDGNGAEYAVTWCYGEPFLELRTNLNPNVSSEGLVIFDVPRGRAYSMKLSGGPGKHNWVFVNLTPE